MEITPVNKTTNVQEIVKQIVDKIKLGELRVGEYLPAERSLAESLQVSRPCLREALSVLEIMGLIRVRQGGKTVIAPLDMKPLCEMLSPILSSDPKFDADLVHFRSVLESDAVRLAARNGASEELGLIVSQMQEQIAEGENIAAQLDFSFHREIFKLSGNLFLAKAMDFVENLLIYSVQYNRTHILAHTEYTDALMAQHLDIYTKIVNRDEAGAQHAMRLHLEFVLDVMSEESK